MAYADYAITNSDIQSVSLENNAPDILEGTPNENKAQFDNFGNMICTKFNSLVQHVETDIPTSEAVLNTIYPIGSVMFSTSSACPVKYGDWAELTGISITPLDGTEQVTIHIFTRQD